MSKALIAPSFDSLQGSTRKLSQKFWFVAANFLISYTKTFSKDGKAEPNKNKIFKNFKLNINKITISLDKAN